MFGLSWSQIIIIVLVGVFLLGPERIPTAVQWVTTTLRKARTMAAGAQAHLRSEIGPELDELRRQIADLQSLKEIQELRELRDLHPRNLIGKGLFGTDDKGAPVTGLGGLLGFDRGLLDAPVAGSGVASTEASAATSQAAGEASVSPPASTSPEAPQTMFAGYGSTPAAESATNGAATNGSGGFNGSPTAPLDLSKPHSAGGPGEVTRPRVPAGQSAAAAEATPFDLDAT